MKALAGFLVAASAFAAVDGTVVNQTTGKPQANAVVTLFKLTEAGPQLVAAAKADAQGKFTIAKDAGEGPLLVEAGFQGVSYNQMLPPGTPRIGVTINVFDATADEAAAPARPAHRSSIEPANGQHRRSAETFLFRNDGKSTYYNPAKGTLRFFAPKDSKGLHVTATSPGGMPVRARAGSRQNPELTNSPIRHQARGETRLDVTYTVPYSDPGEVHDQGLLQRTTTRPRRAERGDARRRQPDIARHGAADPGRHLRDPCRGDRRKDHWNGQHARRRGRSLRGQAEETGPALRVITPPGSGDRQLEILVLAFAVLALGFAMLYRKGRASAVPAAPRSRG